MLPHTTPPLLTACLQLSNNNISGVLPPAWGKAQVRQQHKETGWLASRDWLPPRAARSEGACPLPCPAQALKVLNLAGNNLSGPAFPPTWLGPGTLPNLTFISLSGNRRLSGALPATLAWPMLQEL